LGSGSNVDVAIIKKEGVKVTRSIKHDNFKLFSNPRGYNFPIGTTEVLDEYKLKLQVSEGP